MICSSVYLFFIRSSWLEETPHHSGTIWGEQLTALSLLGCSSYVFNHGIRGAVQDGMLMTLTTLSLLLARLLVREFVHTSERQNSIRQRFYLSAIWGTIIGCAVYTKNVGGFIGAIILGVFLLLSGSLPKVLSKLKWEILLAATLAVLIPATYFAPHIFLTSGAAKIMFGHEIVQRATVGLHNQSNQLFNLIRLFPGRAAVPPELLVAALALASYCALRGRDKRFLFLLVWSVFPVLFFSMIPSRLTWYMAPAFPAMALLVGYLLWTLTTKAYHSWGAWIRGEQRLTGSLGLVTCLCIYGVGLVCFHLTKVAHAVLHTHERIELDVLVQNIKKLGDEPIVLTLNEPRYAYREQAYRNMLERNERQVASAQELITLATKEPHGIILSDVNTFYQVLTKIPVVQYRFVRPRDNRSQWLAVTVFGKDLPLDPMRSVKQHIEFANPAFRTMFGFTEPTSVLLPNPNRKISVRTNDGLEQSMLHDGDGPQFRLGTDMSVSVVVTKPLSLSVFINSRPVLQNMSLSTHPEGLPQSVSWKVDPGIIRRGQNVISFRISAQQPVESEKTPLLSYRTLTTSLRLAQP